MFIDPCAPVRSASVTYVIKMALKAWVAIRNWKLLIIIMIISEVICEINQYWNLYVFLYHQAVLSLLSRLALPLLYNKTNTYINVDFVQLQLDI